MKVMLLSLPGIDESDGNLFPLGIGYLVGSLKRSHEVVAYHFNNIKRAREEIRENMVHSKPDIVGLTCSTFNRGFVREIIKLLKTIDRNIKIVVGGVHASFCYDQILRQYGADVVVIGEGECVLLELCAAVEQNISLKTIKGIAYKENSEVILNPPRNPVNNLDELPMPDYSYAHSFIEQSKMGFIITSRGCPVRCIFCSTSSFWGQKVRMNSVSRVVDEMEILISQFKVKKIFFHDDTFNLGIARVKAICKEIMDRGIKIEWGCSCRVTPVSEEMIACMVEAGCRHICWGIESGSEEILRTINKKISLSQIRNAFESCKKFSDVMSTGAFAMVGNPGESDRTIQDTVSFLNTIPLTDRPSTSTLYILPGTSLYESLKRDGHIRDEDWFKYDSVPRYTLENSRLRLSGWAKLLRNSGKRIPFNPQKHFWYGTLETSDLKADVMKRNPIVLMIKKFKKVVTQPQRIVSKFLLAGRIRF